MPDDGVHRVLVVANETVGGRALLAELQSRLQGEEKLRAPGRLSAACGLCGRALVLRHRRLHPGGQGAHGGLGGGDARSRPERVTGRLGDHHDPNQAIEDALKEFPADEVVISTHTPKRSRWLESGVVEKARAELPQPVTHVVVDLESEASALS